MNLSHLSRWMPQYLSWRMQKAEETPRHLWVTLADHYEPLGGGVTYDVAEHRVAAWEQRWPRIAADAPRDVAGNTPCYTLFYPQEEYDARLLERIAGMQRIGVADVEVHIHHDHDTAQSFAGKIKDFCRRLQFDHGLLRERDGKPAFAFIHGNWALDNSRPDGRWCGVNGETALLKQLGCYADMTMPSVPSPTQGGLVNQIYWAAGSPSHPRSFDQAIAAKPGAVVDHLLMIPGPLGVRYKDRLLPRMETGELAIYDPATPYRVKRWVDLAPRLGDGIFLKLYSHGAREDNASALLGTGQSAGSLKPMFEWIHEEAQRRNLQLHWVSAYDMYCAIEEILLLREDASEGVNVWAGEVAR